MTTIELKNRKSNLSKGEKLYMFTTFDYDNNEVRTYYYEGYHIREIKKIASQIVGNSRDNEERHSRITLA